MDRLTQLRTRVQELQAEAEQIETTASGETRDYTSDELTRIEEVTMEVTEVERQIEGLERVAALRARTSQEGEGDNNQSSGRRTEPARAADHRERGRCGFMHFGEFAIAVASASRQGGPVDNRLARMQPDPSNTGTPAEGGYAVPPDFREMIVKHVTGGQSLLGLTDQYFTAYNQVTIPEDSTTPWQTTGGILSYWIAEGAKKTESKVALGQQVVPLHKLACLVTSTDELLADSPMMDSYIRNKAPEKMRFMVDDAIVNGDGSGKPIGLIGHASEVAVTRNTGGTVLFEDINAMWAAMYPPSRSSAVWLINSDVEPLLIGMAFDSTATSKVPVWLPGNSMAGQPHNTLLGRPVIPHEAMPALNAKGDICLWDPLGYMSVLKTGGGIREDVSIHLYFDYDVTAFRFVLRVGGEPWLDAPIARKAGGEFGQTVVLAAGV